MKQIKKIDIVVTIISMFLVLCGNPFILKEFEGRYTTYNSKNWNTDLEFNPLPAGNISIFADDFESGLSKWDSVTGLWHLTDNVSYSDPYHSPTHSIWFGNESTGFYYNGSWWARGNLTSIPIDLSSVNNAYLEFYHWKEVEEYRIFDNSSVFISTDNVIWDMLYQNNTNKAPWEKLTFNISSYCGNSSVRIRFYFDSVEELYNNFRGWLVDDVRIFYTVDNNNPPTLTLGSVSPNPGKISDLFTYTVNYVDIDGDAPTYVNVSINGTYYSMSKQNPYDYEYTDGCIYEYKTYLDWSAYPYDYSFGCFDGKFFTILGPFIGPIVKYPPSSPSISINSGDASTNSTLVTLSLLAVGAEEMCFRNGTTGTWTAWEAYSTTKQLYLAGSINNTVYTICAKFQNATGESFAICDNILYLEGITPTGPFISGYSLEWLAISLVGVIGIILLFKKKKRLKLKI